jgi:hypothetical protein
MHSSRTRKQLNLFCQHLWADTIWRWSKYKITLCMFWHKDWSSNMHMSRLERTLDYEVSDFRGITAHTVHNTVCTLRHSFTWLQKHQIQKTFLATFCFWRNMFVLWTFSHMFSPHTTCGNHGASSAQTSHWSPQFPTCDGSHADCSEVGWLLNTSHPLTVSGIHYLDT